MSAGKVSVDADHGGSRGLIGRFERAWSGEPGTVAWTKALLPAAAIVAAVTAVARKSAAGSRRARTDLHVIAVGGLTVGGAGKTSVARWLAREAVALGAHPAILLRGHGRRDSAHGNYVVPDYDGYPREAAFRLGGDEAAAHRARLPREATVGVDRDRFRAAEVAASGYGATVMILDDGWEQASLQWSDLWVVLDPFHPLGNGSSLPAGPLRRPPSTLGDAKTIAFILDTDGVEIPRETIAWTRSMAPGASLLRFLRVLDGTSEVGQRAVEPWTWGGGPAALLSGVGSPTRVTRFARAAGIDVVSHAAFPDHAHWSEGILAGALRDAAARGATVALITEKDEPRWPSSLGSPIPIRVLRTSLRPHDPTDAALERLRSAARAAGAAGRAVEGVPHR